MELSRRTAVTPRKATGHKAQPLKGDSHEIITLW